MILYRAWWFFFSYKKGQTKYFRLYGPYDLYCNYTTSKLMHTYKILNLYYNVLCFVTQLCLTLCNPLDCSLPASSVHGFSRQEYRSGLTFPSPGNLPDPGMEHVSPALAGGFFTRKTLKCTYNHQHQKGFKFIPQILNFKDHYKNGDSPCWLLQARYLCCSAWVDFELVCNI